jgi:Tol biopolymer transport system component
MYPGVANKIAGRASPASGGNQEVGDGSMYRRLALLVLIAAMGILLGGRSALARPLSQVQAPAAPGTYVVHLATGAVTPVAMGENPPAVAAWSPDGTMLALSQGTLAIVDPANGASTPISVDATGLDGRPSWSPDGSGLAFTISPVGRAGPPSLYLAPAGGGAAASIYSGNIASYSGPLWTPDGRAITVQQFEGGVELTGTSILDVDPSGAAPPAALIGDLNSCLALRSWSPDGAFLAFVGPIHQGCEQRGIWTWEAATGMLRQLYDGGNGDAKWMADGSLLAEICCDSGSTLGAPHYSLRAFQPDGSGDRLIVDGLPEPFPGPYDRAFDTAAGAVLYALRDCAANTASAWVVDAAGGPPRRLSDASSYAYQPRLSPDGRTVAWVAAGTTGSDLVVAAEDGSGSRTVLSGATGLGNLEWSPDGSALLFQVTSRQFKDCIGP